MFSIFSATSSRQNDYAEGFENLWENKMDNLHVGLDYLIGIQGQASQTVMFKPLRCILNQRKYLPIRFMPLTIELSLVDVMTDPIVSNSDHNGFSALNTSLYVSIMIAQVKCNLVTLDRG